jgi:dipeptidyl aminopeptidase/acylaminoacyl peptidase
VRPTGLALVLAGALAPAAARAQAGAALPDLATMMRGPELYGREPESVRWSPDGTAIWFRWLEPGARWDEPLAWYRVVARPGARPERVTPEAADSAGPALAAGPLDPGRGLRAVEFAGDLFLVPQGGGRPRRLTRTTAEESEPAWSGDGRRVHFEREGNAWALDREGSALEQLSDLRPGPRPPRDTTSADSARTPQRQALRQAERELLAAVRDRVRRDSLDRQEREAARQRRELPVVWLDDRETARRVAVAPDASAVLVLAARPAAAARLTRVPAWVTEDGYVGSIEGRTKVGDAPGRLRAGLLRLDGDSTIRWLDLLPGDSAPPAELWVVGWRPGHAEVALAVISADRSRRRLVSAALSPGDSVRLVVLDELRDTAWVGGPCFSCAGWTPDGERFWFVSEAGGWAHLHDVRHDGTARRRLTAGEWEVRAADLSEDGREFRLETSEASPFERHVYRLPAGGGDLRRVTARPGRHEAVFSPDGRRMAVIHSAANQPPELFLQEARAGAAPARLTHSPSPAFDSVAWVAPEVIAIPASDGARVPARIYRPTDLGARANGAAVIFVHGAGYLQNAHRWWSEYPREYLFHHLLASRGYLVLDLDYRGSAGHGRAWRTAVAGWMGGRDLQDQVDASRWLRDSAGVAPERVGIYGGSYGGFLTLMALFTEPEWFGAGAALRPVTDWAHYNHGYTADILGLPQADSASFRRSSPIRFAEGLQDPLLIAHGMQDTNVQFQDVVRLAQRLIELGKAGWELAAYPAEDHGFQRPDSWIDEYRRILELFERHLGPR